ncbi:unnamed protein product [Rhizophagus irregularis]|nr:unnamed protein product [Rhizophagus irregularis]
MHLQKIADNVTIVKHHAARNEQEGYFTEINEDFYKGMSTYCYCMAHYYRNNLTDEKHLSDIHDQYNSFMEVFKETKNYYANIATGT